VTAKGVDGSDGYVTVVAGLVALGAGIMLMQRTKRALAILALVAGLVGGGLGVYDALTARDNVLDAAAEELAPSLGASAEQVRVLLDEAIDAGQLGISTSFGLFVVIGGGVLALIGGVMSMKGSDSAVTSGFAATSAPVPSVESGPASSMPETPAMTQPPPTPGEGPQNPRGGSTRVTSPNGPRSHVAPSRGGAAITRNRVIYAVAAGILALAFLGGLWFPAYYYTDTLPPNELALARLLADRYAAEHPGGCPRVGPESRRCNPDPTPVRSSGSVAGRVALLFAGAVIAGLLMAFGTTSRRARSRNRGGCIGAVVGCGQSGSRIPISFH